MKTMAYSVRKRISGRFHRQLRDGKLREGKQGLGIKRIIGKSRAAGFALLAGCALFLTGCETFGTEEKVSTRTDVKSPIESRSIATRGVQALREGDLELASRMFNGALKLEVQNSYLQFLNALAYHMIAIRADRTKFALAEQGYNLAIKFDETNWMARYYLGLMYLDQRQYKRAKAAFADAMLYNDSYPDLLYNFTVASYYARDPETAAGPLTRLQEVEPGSGRMLRASSIITAALGRAQEAQTWLKKYKKIEKNKQKTRQLDRRVNDWGRVHARVQKASLRPPASTMKITRGVQLAQDQDSPEQSGQMENTEQETSEAENNVNGEPAAVLAEQNKMVIVDVVIISSVEDITTAKGVNLLSGLQIQFGAGTEGALSATRTITRDNVTGNRTGDDSSIIQRLTIPAITYSLNIANAGSTRNEILARPSLVAIEGQKSEFFSGENIKASSVSTTAQEGATEVERDVGVKLGVTPERVGSENVKLLVEVERTFLQTPSTSVDFDFQIRTSKTTIAANVVLRRGETLILGGLSEKETESIRDGVPGLQDVPLIQYLFSRATTRDFNRSVLVLVTPRTPEYTYSPRDARKLARAARGENEDQVLNELKARYTDWFRPYPNWASVFRHLQNNALYREFRTADVALERWDTQSSHGARLKTALDFLYF
jgi:Flp pilus assembly secretin CpaC/Flp pilus assembly protein TadD